MFDILSNHLVTRIRAYSEQSIGTESIDVGDVWTGGTRPQRALCIIDVGANAGTLILTIQDSPDDSTFDTDFITLSTISDTGLKLFDLCDFERYIHISAVVAGGACSWCGYVVTFENRWRPITQTGTVLTATYGTGRKPRVASS